MRTSRTRRKRDKGRGCWEGEGRSVEEWGVMQKGEFRNGDQEAVGRKQEGGKGNKNKVGKGNR